MPESKHTPGPWTISHSSDKRTGTCIRTVEPVVDGARDGMAICRMVSAPGLTETRANASLISAAPEMYEALRTATELLRGLADSEERAGKHNAAVNVRAVGERLYAALAKAEGREP